MHTRLFHNFSLLGVIFLVGFALTGCETPGKKVLVEPPQQKIEPKKEKPDLNKMTLEEIHNLPAYRECRERLARAEVEVKKRSVVKIVVKPMKGMSGKSVLQDMFYLEPSAETYPQDSSIRTYHCPETINDVMVTYTLNIGPGFSPLYHFDYHGDQKKINVSNSVKPEGVIKLRFDDKPPSITFNIVKVEAKSFHPSYSFSNEDMDFILENIEFGAENHLNIRVKNKSKRNLAIKKFRITIGNRNFEVDFKKDILKLKPGETILKNNINAGRSNTKWFVTDGNKFIMVVARVVYQAGWDFKKLKAERYTKITALGINGKMN